MSSWLDKSKYSFEIANNEAVQTFYDSRVHSYYYGCVQLLKHVVLQFPNMTVLIVDDLCDKTEHPSNGGTHVFLKSKIIDDLIHRTEILKKVDFNKCIINLKHLRIKADYSFESITKEEIELAKNYTLTINTIISKVYNIKNDD